MLLVLSVQHLLHSCLVALLHMEFFLQGALSPSILNLKASRPRCHAPAACRQRDKCVAPSLMSKVGCKPSVQARQPGQATLVRDKACQMSRLNSMGCVLRLRNCA